MPTEWEKKSVSQKSAQGPMLDFTWACHRKKYIVKPMWSQNSSDHCEESLQCLSDRVMLVDFAIRLVNSVLNIPWWENELFWEIKLQKNCNQSCSSRIVLRLVEMTLRLVHARYSLPQWQAINLTFFAPCWLKRTFNLFLALSCC